MSLQRRSERLQSTSMNDQIPNLTPLFNRASDGSFKLPEDGWFHLVPKGVFPIVNPDPTPGEPKVLKQVVDDRALQLMANRFEIESKAKNFPGLLVDFDHFSYDTDKSSEAAGWVGVLQNRADGLWGQVKWTPKGEEALKGGAYRFISPVWGKRDAEKLKNSEFRPTRLETLGLTNQPNLRGMTPLSNRTLPASEAETVTTKPMKKVSEYLGLSPDAAEDAVLAEVTKLKNRATELETTNTTLTKENGELKTGQVDLALDKYKNRFKAEKREAWKNRLTADYAGSVEILEETPVIPSGGSNGAGARPSDSKFLNRKDASTPEGGQGGEATEESVVQFVNQVKLRNRCTFEEAWNLARGEKPELFKQKEAAE